jgi:hypothetical protein
MEEYHLQENAKISACLSVFLILHPSIHPSICLFIYRSTAFCWAVGLLGQGISPSQGSYLYKDRSQKKRTQTSMLQMGFGPTTSVFERAKFMP